ncbi:PEP-CTERM sorting domain-containing protein [Candidatus Poribacteria bacterium]|nr:PEP-CTERM sorting domain-containing protein [Candidatus Poribacteria bacterium]
MTVPSSGVVPEPSTLCLLAVGICFLFGVIGIRQRKKAA